MADEPEVRDDEDEKKDKSRIEVEPDEGDTIIDEGKTLHGETPGIIRPPDANDRNLPPVLMAENRPPELPGPPSMVTPTDASMQDIQAANPPEGAKSVAGQGIVTPAQPTVPTQPAAPAQPTTPAQPAAPAQPTTPAQPAAPAAGPAMTNPRNLGAMLFSKAENINNPFLRVLAKVGSVGLGAAQGAARNVENQQARKLENEEANQPIVNAQHQAQTNEAAERTKMMQTQRERLDQPNYSISKPMYNNQEDEIGGVFIDPRHPENYKQVIYGQTPNPGGGPTNPTGNLVSPEAPAGTPQTGPASTAPTPAAGGGAGAAGGPATTAQAPAYTYGKPIAADKKPMTPEQRAGVNQELKDIGLTPEQVKRFSGELNPRSSQADYKQVLERAQSLANHNLQQEALKTQRDETNRRANEAERIKQEQEDAKLVSYKNAEGDMVIGPAGDARKEGGKGMRVTTPAEEAKARQAYVQYDRMVDNANSAAETMGAWNNEHDRQLAMEISKQFFENIHTGWNLGLSTGIGVNPEYIQQFRNSDNYRKMSQQGQMHMQNMFQIWSDVLNVIKQESGGVPRGQQYLAREDPILPRPEKTPEQNNKSLRDFVIRMAKDSTEHARPVDMDKPKFFEGAAVRIPPRPAKPGMKWRLDTSTGKIEEVAK